MYYKQIKGISSLKDFLHCAFLWKNWIKIEWVSTWKWLKKIALQENSSVKTICNRNNRCQNKFWLKK